jgi:hypothetical protein
LIAHTEKKTPNLTLLALAQPLFAFLFELGRTEAHLASKKEK